mgnify:CR=1 FL=1
MARKNNLDYDLIVIGSGAAGSTAALAAAKAGKKVALIEGATFGGESPNWGDVPVSALLQSAHLYHEAKAGVRFGLRSQMLSYNFPTILAWRDKAIKRTGAADNQQYYEKTGIKTYAGAAHFLTPHEISVNRTHLTAHNFLIATGSHFEQPDVYGIETITYKTPQTLIDSKRIPRSLFIVGANSDAIEYAQLLATFGTKVYIAERSARILPDEDPEVGELMESYLGSNFGITSLTQTQLVQVEPKGLGVRVSYSRGGTTKVIQVDDILFLSNRVPTTDLGLENASVSYSRAGIEVNEHLQTTAKHIYAAGNVTSGDCPTQIALLHGRIAAHNILSKNKLAADTFGIPRVTFSSPSIASVGLSENDCIKRDLAINQAIAPLTMIARSNTSDFAYGFVKLIADKKGTLLGGTIVAPHAEDMIQEISLALRHGFTAADLANAPHAFLSWSEAIRTAAAKLV